MAPHPGQHPEDLLERAHLPDRPQLVAEVLQRELVTPDLLLQLRRVFRRDGLFGLLDERQHVAHAEHARHDAVRVERLQVLQPLAAADKRDRHADDADDRQRRAAARVAVHLRQHDAGDADPPVEFTGALDRVLPGHRIGDKQQIDGRHRGLDRLQLVHQLVVDVQPARRVDDDDVEAAVLRFGQRARRALDRIHLAGRVVHAHAGLFPDDRQLVNRRGASHVGRDEQRMPSLLRQPLPELGRRRRLARALQAQQHDDARRLARRLQPALGVAEQRQHLVAHDAHDLLIGRQAAEHFLVDGPIAHAIDERLDDLEVDVRLEQRHPDFPERQLDGLFGKPAPSADVAENVLQPIGEGLEHDHPRALNVSSANPYGRGIGRNRQRVTAIRHHDPVWGPPSRGRCKLLT